MDKFIVSVVALVVFCFGVGVLKKLVYAARVERELRASGVRPNDIETKIGRSKYGECLFFFRRQGFDPKNAARTLDLYVLKGFAEYSTDTSEQELELLRVLGMGREES